MKVDVLIYITKTITPFLFKDLTEGDINQLIQVMSQGKGLLTGYCVKRERNVHINANYIVSIEYTPKEANQ